MFPDFTDRTCLITGAARGLGRAIATRIAAAGGTVPVCDRDGEVARETAAQLGGEGRAEAFIADISDAGAVKKLAGEIGARHRVDVLVNNAGFYSGKPSKTSPRQTGISSSRPT